MVYDNWPSAYNLRDVVESKILLDVKNGKRAGPFNSPPFINFVGSGALNKKHSSKMRLIQDLSWSPKLSVNEFMFAAIYFRR